MLFGMWVPKFAGGGGVWPINLNTPESGPDRQRIDNGERLLPTLKLFPSSNLWFIGHQDALVDPRF